MQVVYSPAHLGHDITVETFMGLPIPANEVAERAERIKLALDADGGFPRSEPTEHGEAPITAVHDPGLLRFLEVAWSELRRQGLPRPFLTADTYPNRQMFEGMSVDSVSALVREPTHAAGRAGYWGLDSAAPLVAGTYPAARAAVDVALTAADIVLGGAVVAYGLCRPPGHHAARSMYGGYCFFNNAAIAAEAIVRATGERVAILDVDYHHGNGIQQIFYNRPDVQYVSLHGDPDRAYPYFVGFADEMGAGKGLGTNLNLPLPEKCDDERYLTELERALDAVDRFDPALVIVSLGVDTYGQDPIGDFALTRDSYPAAGAAVAALGRPMLIVQEGGYYVPALGQNVRSWLRGAAGLPA
jgi:acetoin utilization deacetylase AcuC-like enzyme